MQIREDRDGDLEDVLRVERLAFGRDDEADLVVDLLRDPTARPLLSLLSEREGRCVGHFLFTAIELVGAATPVACSILAPLAVLPEVQGTGVGRGLIEEGCRIFAERGVGLVFVLGDPDYYGSRARRSGGSRGRGSRPRAACADWMARASAGPLEFDDLLFEARPELVLLDLDVVVGLQVDPEPLRHPEVPRKSESGVG